MANNLAAYFADRNQKHMQQSNSAPITPTLSSFKSSVDKTDKKHDDCDDSDDMGPSVSMAVQADNDDSFERSTFNLKRTRSMGLFDDYIDPTKKLLGKSQNADDKTTAEEEKKECGQKDYDNSASIVLDNNDTKDDGSDQSDDSEASDEYNSDSDSNTDSNSDDNGYNTDSDDDDDEVQHREESPSVSPPPADTDVFLLPQDDNDLVREPERHVDYLSHEWNEWDISKSWKYIILKKKKRAEDLVNAARLENASWRTWAKARNHLKTVSPEVVNWSKDSDVTWLYGPIVRDQDDDETSNPQRGYGSDDENSKRVAAPKKKKKKATSHTPKPILKKRTVSEILEENAQWKLNEARKHMYDMKHASVVMDPYGGVGESHDDYNDYDALAAKVNAQYYRSNKHNQNTATEHSQFIDAQSDKVPNSTNESSSSNEKEADIQEGTQPKIYDAKNGTNAKESGNDALATVEGDERFSSRLKSNMKSEKTNKIRHIHFNDRVEQCMALATPSSESELSDDEDAMEDSTSSRGQIGSKSSSSLDSNGSDTSSSSGAESDDDDDDNAGLFINPTISRRAESVNHFTDSSSQNSSIHSRFSINPIIKLLPATTLNYGSDDEGSDNSDYNGSYGNAVSHNVNTYRGYDYMYDYNSVYTGDTSNFLPVDNCDVVDVPDGIDLHAAMAADNASTYELGHAVASGNNGSDHDNNTSKKLGTHNFLYDSPHDSSSDSEEQFIENSQYRSSDDDDDGLALKRTISLGKSGNSSSLRDLTRPPSGSSVGLAKTHSFITGSPTDTANNNVRDVKNLADASKFSARPSNSTGRPRCLKRNSSSSSFIFNSDSEEEEEEEDEEDPESKQGDYEKHDQGMDEATSQDLNSRLRNYKEVCKPVPPQSSVISSDSRAFPSSSASPKLLDKSNSIRLKNASSLAEVGASDVAISGSFSPRSGSVKSAVSSKGIADKTSSKELSEMNENLKAYHLDDENEGANDESNESLQRMMQNARDIAHKYLHSWKKPENKEEDQKTGTLRKA